MNRRSRSGAPRSAHAVTGHVRVIGGRWRGRKLAIIDSPGLRPSPDRLRETLFNWLAPTLPGAHVLDLFAGSGALGAEAASRGAASVTLVERDPAVASRLRENLAPLLEPDDQVTVLQSDWAEVLQDGRPPADIVFVDPPFAENLHARVLAVLANGPLAEGARVHLEQGVRQTIDIPAVYSELKCKRFGDVQATLLTI